MSATTLKPDVAAFLSDRLAKVKEQFTYATLQNIFKSITLPLVGIIVFGMLWHVSSQNINTSLGKFPGPVQVWEQVQALSEEHDQVVEKRERFYERQETRNAKKLEKNPDAVIKWRKYTGAPSFFDLIGTSLITVLAGFLIAAIIAVPLGIFCGLSNSVNAAMNPLIQVFKPVSPLAWLPLVTMVVSALYQSDDPVVSKSFLNSAITVSLCCLWPALINTAVGVANISKDLVNVSQVLRLNYIQHIMKIVLPSSIPMIFTGLRLSLGIGWMVLIAAEMLAQNPGLGKFVWDEFQNGSSASLARIMVAVLVIGLIGFMLDRIMLQLQKVVSWDKNAVLR
jgi:nitrate/nitrite transport system permease protein